MKRLATALLLFVTVNSFASDSVQNETFWATSVHNLMIDLAFPDETEACRQQMKDGSREVDRHQESYEAYMHAMRSKGESEQEASQEMWEFVDMMFEAAKDDAWYSTSWGKNSREHQYWVNVSCFERGQALHPIMDSTSPAHHGFKAWEPFSNPSQIFQHGDWVHQLERYLPLSIPANFSQEDMDYIDDHPEVLSNTASIMKTVDLVGMATLKH